MGFLRYAVKSGFEWIWENTFIQGGYMYTQGWAAYPIAFPSVCLYANSVAYSSDWDYHDSMRNTTGLTIHGDGYNKLFIAVGY